MQTGQVFVVCALSGCSISFFARLFPVYKFASFSHDYALLHMLFSCGCVVCLFLVSLLKTRLIISIDQITDFAAEDL